MKKQTAFQRMGIKKMTRRKNEKTLTQRERYLKRKKATKEFEAWFK